MRGSTKPAYFPLFCILSPSPGPQNHPQDRSVAKEGERIYDRKPCLTGGRLRTLAAHSPGTLVPASHGFVVGEDLVRQLVDKLIKAQVHLGTGKQERQLCVSSLHYT